MATDRVLAKVQADKGDIELSEHRSPRSVDDDEDRIDHDRRPGTTHEPLMSSSSGGITIGPLRTPLRRKRSKKSIKYNDLTADEVLENELVFNCDTGRNIISLISFVKMIVGLAGCLYDWQLALPGICIGVFGLFSVCTERHFVHRWFHFLLFGELVAVWMGFMLYRSVMLLLDHKVGLGSAYLACSVIGSLMHGWFVFYTYVYLSVKLNINLNYLQLLGIQLKRIPMRHLRNITERKLTERDKEYWQKMYAETENVPWDAKAPSQLVKYLPDLFVNIHGLSDCNRRRVNIFVPLCGGSRDLLAIRDELASIEIDDDGTNLRNFRVYGCDLSRHAIEWFLNRESLEHTKERIVFGGIATSMYVYKTEDGLFEFICGNIFDPTMIAYLREETHWHSIGYGGGIHYFFDVAAFVAIKPEDRERYANMMHSVMSENARGLIMATRYDRKKRWIDPYPITEGEVDGFYCNVPAKKRRVRPTARRGDKYIYTNRSFKSLTKLHSIHLKAEDFKQIPMEPLGAEEAWLDMYLLKSKSK